MPLFVIIENSNPKSCVNWIGKFIRTIPFLNNKCMNLCTVPCNQIPHNLKIHNWGLVLYLLFGGLTIPQHTYSIHTWPSVAFFFLLLRFYEQHYRFIYLGLHAWKDMIHSRTHGPWLPIYLLEETPLVFVFSDKNFSRSEVTMGPATWAWSRPTTARRTCGRRWLASTREEVELAWL